MRECRDLCVSSRIYTFFWRIVRANRDLCVFIVYSTNLAAWVLKEFANFPYSSLIYWDELCIEEEWRGYYRATGGFALVL